MKPKMILTHGLPGCGKSTWAKKEQAKNPLTTVIVERDEIRHMLYGDSYPGKNGLSKKKEREVSVIADDLTRKALSENKTVIVSDTNLNPHIIMTRVKIAREYNADIQQQSFNIPIEECKRRNKARGEAGGRFVPENIIENMAENTYHDNNIKEFRIGEKMISIVNTNSDGKQKVLDYNKKQKIALDDNGHKSIVFDCDGTLFDMRHAANQAFGTHPKKRDFHLFHKAARTAPENKHVTQALKDAYKNGFKIIVVTGRTDDYADETLEWLKEKNLPVHEVHMRESGDYRADYEIKRDIVHQIQNNGDSILLSYDDNPQVLALWKELKIRTIEIPYHPTVHPDDAPSEYPEIIVENAFSNENNGVCVKCGRSFKGEGFLGPVCSKK